MEAIKLSMNELIQKVLGRDTVGIDVRQEPELMAHYREIKDARSDARDIERQSWLEGIAEDGRQHWQCVQQKATELLAEHSCDIELMAWLSEALLRTEGYQGCAKGFELLRCALEKFSAAVYPSLDEGEGIEWKVLALTGLNGEESDGSMIMPLCNVAVCDQPRVSLWQYTRAHEIEKMDNSDAKRRLLDDSALTYEEIINAVRQLDRKNMEVHLRGIHNAIEQFSLLENTLTALFGPDAPPTSRIRRALDDAEEQLSYLMREVFGEAACQLISNEEQQTEQVNSLSDNATIAANGSYTRAMALNELLKIADFFKHSEPQSPLPTMLARVVTWADLSWPELMAKLVSDPNELEQVFHLTGIAPQEENN